MATSAGAATAPNAEPRGVEEAAARVVEARADPRVALDMPVELSGTNLSTPLKARARDLSVGGVCVATRYMFDLRSVRRARFRVGRETLNLDLDGRWQFDSPTEESFLTGFAFVRPERAAVATLWDLVHTAGKTLALFLHEQSEVGTLGTEDAVGIAQISRLRSVPAGRLIYAQDGSARGDDSIFILQSGAVQLRHRFGPADEVNLGRLEPGAIFGGLPIIADMANLESAFAEDDCTLVEVSRAAHTRLRLARPLLAQRLTQIASRSHVQRVRRLLRAVARR